MKCQLLFKNYLSYRIIQFTIVMAYDQAALELNYLCRPVRWGGHLGCPLKPLKVYNALDLKSNYSYMN